MFIRKLSSCLRDDDVTQAKHIINQVVEIMMRNQDVSELHTRLHRE